jgi:hypothetical protein
MRQNININKNKNKKAQEEVFGFVIIVLVVMVIGIVFFAFSLRQATEGTEPSSYEMDDLLFTMQRYTTNCQINNLGINIKELIRECNNNPSRICEDIERDVCGVLEEELNDMLDEFLGTDIANALVHSYFLNITSSEDIIYIEKGELTGNFIETSSPIQALISGEQEILVILRFYY